MELRREDKEWIEKVIKLGYTRLQVKKKLEEAKFKDERIDAYLEYFSKKEEEYNKKEEVVEEKYKNKTKKEEEDFRDNVKKYFSENKKELSGKEKREVKRFIKEVDKYSKVIKVAISNFRKELDSFGKRGLELSKIDRELKYLKEEIIDRLIESKEILEIEHPVTGEEANKENLKQLEIDELIKLMEDNTKSLDQIVNGKITE